MGGEARRVLIGGRRRRERVEGDGTAMFAPWDRNTPSPESSPNAAGNLRSGDAGVKGQARGRTAACGWNLAAVISNKCGIGHVAGASTTAASLPAASQSRWLVIRGALNRCLLFAFAMYASAGAHAEAPSAAQRKFAFLCQWATTQMPATHPPSPCDPGAIAKAAPNHLEVAANEYWAYWLSLNSKAGADARARFEKAYRNSGRNGPSGADLDPVVQGLKEFNDPGSERLSATPSTRWLHGVPRRRRRSSERWVSIRGFSWKSPSPRGPLLRHSDAAGQRVSQRAQIRPVGL